MLLFQYHRLTLSIEVAPHGECFWKWARIAESGVKNQIKVTTCHSYDINRPFKFTCTNSSCAKVYGRHSKKGIDIRRQLCGICHSTLVYSGKMNPDGTVSDILSLFVDIYSVITFIVFFQPQKERVASGFSLFVKEHYSAVKASKVQNLARTPSSLSHGDVMRTLSKMYAETRVSETSNNNIIKNLFA